MLLRGELFTGHNGAAAEPGLIGVQPDGPACNSGNRGSLEQFASITGLRRLCDRDPRELSAEADGGDPEALGVWSRYGQHLGCGIASLVYVFTPQLVLLGGGLAGAARHFCQRCAARLSRGFRPSQGRDCGSKPPAWGTALDAWGLRGSLYSG